MKTFRRDKLRRLIKAGRVETISTYYFDDMSGAHRIHEPMPVAMKPDDWHNRKHGICYITEHDLTSKSGCCYVLSEQDNIVTLIVNGNSNYEFRIKA